MKKTNMLIILILSLGLMLTACGSGEKDNNDSIYVPPPFTSSSDDGNENLFSYTPNFVAVGEDGIIVHSDDGTNWNVNESQLGTNKTLRDIASGSWVAVGSHGNDGFVIKSDDAISLQTTDLIADGIASLAGIASDGNGTWVAVGFDSNSKGIIATSDDGSEWKIEIALDAEVYKDVAYGEGTFIAVGLDLPGENGILRSSVDWAVNQDKNGDLIGIPLHDVAYDGDGKWFAIGANTFNSIIEFDSNWNILPGVPVGNIKLNGIASDGNGNLIAVGEDQGKGIVVTSNNWTDLIQASDDNLMGVVYDGGENWIAVGTNGTIVTMPTSTPSVISTDISVTDKVLKAIGVKP